MSVTTISYTLRSCIIALVVMIATGTSLSPGYAQSNSATQDYKPGRDYTVLATPVRTDNQSKIEAAFVFSYGNALSHQAQAMMSNWIHGLAADTNLVYVPATWNKIMALDSRIFYTLKTLRLLPTFHQRAFDARMVERRMFNNLEQWAAWFEQNGGNKTNFLKAARSFGVDSQVKQADARVRSYRILGVPTIVINGRYLVDAKHQQDLAKMFSIANYLIAKSRVEKR